MLVLFKRICYLNILIILQLYLFDHVILLIALYGCEMWGFEKSQIIDNWHNDFLRQIINLRKSIPIYMLHAELGRHSIQININYQLSMEKNPNYQNYCTQQCLKNTKRVLIRLNGSAV